MKTAIQALVIAAATLFTLNSWACTDFRLSAKDNSVIVARSMEYERDMFSNLRSSPRGRAFSSTTPDGKPGLAWKAKYGYVYLDGFNYDAALDGMNEQGLSFEALYLPLLAQYQTIPPGMNAHGVSYVHLGDWILGNFKTVDEVRQALSTVFVFEQKIDGMNNMVFPLHYSVYDATGKGIVIEYVAGKLHLYDSIGVLTNSPSYDWHLTNLNNYVHLRPVNPPPIIAQGIEFAATGQGFGMVGLPGDISPPSRFVKMAVLTDVALQMDDALSTVNLAEHIINNVDIPRGLTRDPQSGNYVDETTEWTVFKDLSHRIFYYRTYGNFTLRAVDLKKVDFSENAPQHKMPIVAPEYIQDVTDQFRKTQ